MVQQIYPLRRSNVPPGVNSPQIKNHCSSCINVKNYMTAFFSTPEFSAFFYCDVVIRHILEFVAAIVEWTWSSGENSIIAVTRRVVGRVAESES